MNEPRGGGCRSGSDGWRKEWKLTWLRSTCGESKPVSMSGAHLRFAILAEWLTGKRFAGIIIVILMDIFNVLETREFPMCWFVYLPESQLWCWGRAGGGAVLAISQQTEDQSGDKIVNLTWIKITARLNSPLISEPDKFKIKYKHQPSFRYRGWKRFGFEGIFSHFENILWFLRVSADFSKYKSPDYFPIIFYFFSFTTISWPFNNNLFTIIYKIVIWLNYQFFIFPFYNQLSPGWRLVPSSQLWPDTEKRKLGEKNVKINRLIRIRVIKHD